MTCDHSQRVQLLVSKPMRMGWVAGIIEGEGWIGVHGNGLPVVQVVMTDKDVIDRIHEWTAIGNVITQSRPTVTGKTVYRWSVTKRDDAGALLDALLPLLGKRRSKAARDAIDAWRSYPTLGTAPTCKRGHPLKGMNLRLSEGRRRCRKCIALRARKYRAQIREAA